MKAGRRSALAVLALCGAGLGPAAAEAVRYRLDPDHSFVWFEVRHFGTSTLRGRFGPIAGDVTLDREAGRGEVGLRIATAGVFTGVRVLDSRLRQGDLLASEASPEAFFVARNFSFKDGALASLRGEFTLRNVGQPLTLTALRFGCRDDEQGRQVCGGDFEGRVRRSDFGMTFGLPFVSDDVRLLVQVEGVRQ